MSTVAELVPPPDTIRDLIQARFDEIKLLRSLLEVSERVERRIKTGLTSSNVTPPPKNRAAALKIHTGGDHEQ